MTPEQSPWEQRPGPGGADASGWAATPPGYSAGNQPATPPGPGAPVTPNPYPQNWMGIVALVAPFVFWIVPFSPIAGIVFGHLSIGANRRGEANNAGMAHAGLVISYVFVVLGLLGIAAYIGFAVWAVQECATNPSSNWCSSGY